MKDQPIRGLIAVPCRRQSWRAVQTPWALLPDRGAFPSQARLFRMACGCFPLAPTAEISASRHAPRPFFIAVNQRLSFFHHTRDEIRIWATGPSWVIVTFGSDGKTFYKDIHLATAFETLRWYAKNGAAKIGVKLD